MKKVVVIILIVVFGMLRAKAQLPEAFTIEGQIRTSVGPASGVSIYVKKHMAGATTSDTNGKFILKGVKYNDIIVFSCIGLKKAYFLADKIYNYVFFDIPLDTLLTIPSGYTFNDRYGVADGYNNSMVKAAFKETGEVVRQQSLTQDDSNRVFTRVEIYPSFTSRSFMFVDTLIKEIKKNEVHFPKNEVAVSMYYTITKQNKIVVNAIEANCGDTLKQLITNCFQAANKVKAGMQNGRYVNVVCRASFIIRKDKEEYSVKLIN